jgi:hypothetical protein
MGAHWWLRLGDTLRSLMTSFVGLSVGYVISPFPDHLGPWAIVALIAGVSAAILVGIVVHELGHVLAIRLAGRWPTAIHLLGPPDRVAFHVGAMRVGVGISLAAKWSIRAVVCRPRSPPSSLRPARQQTW